MSEPSGAGRASLIGRLLGLYAVIFLATLALFGAVVAGATNRVLEQQIIDDLVEEARVIDAALPPGDDVAARAIAAGGRFRLTIIDPEGSVVFDSQFDAESMEDHGGRPEVLQAMQGGTGTDSRRSATLGDERLYVAVMGSDGSRLIRLSVTAAALDEDLANVRSAVLRVAALVGVLGLGLVWSGARRVARPVVELTAIAEGVAGGDRNPPMRRSSVAEVDRLGVSLSEMASQLGRRIDESEGQRRLLDSVLGALPQGVLLISEDDRILYANETSEDLLGPFEDRVSTIAPRGFHRCVRAAREGAGERTTELERGSPRRILSLTATLLEGESRVLVVVEDVTGSKRIEAIRRDFVADASHELKTPVASILATAETLQLALTRDPDRARTFAERMEASARQLARIVDDLLDLSRLESSDRQFEPLRLDRVVADEVDSVRGRARESGIELTVDLDEIEIMGSDADIGLAVRNLCDNALRYTDSGGSVNVGLKQANAMAEISVTDTGVGIPTRSLERVFERFYRVDEARSRATGGTGLGLSIVRHVAQRHGGSVEVTSQLGVGSTFTIRLPS